jgi:hypothetical protein
MPKGKGAKPGSKKGQAQQGNKAEKMKAKNTAATSAAAEAAEKHWASIRDHVMVGEVDGKVVKGFHSKKKDNDAVCKAVGEPSAKDFRGCYTQAVQSKVSGISKNDASTFFPDEWDEGLIKQVVVSAYQTLKGAKDQGKAKKLSGQGIANVTRSNGTVIDMKIEFKEGTAYPVYEAKDDNPNTPVKK